MSKAKRTLNTLNKTAMQKLEEQISRSPFAHVKTAVYLNDLTPLQLTRDPAFEAKCVSASVEIRDETTLRIYRKADSGEHDYDVDEIRGINRPFLTYPSKADVQNHHLNGTVQDDFMRRNNITFEAIPDGSGGVSLNVRPDGTIQAFINFLEPNSPESE